MITYSIRDRTHPPFGRFLPFFNSFWVDSLLILSDFPYVMVDSLLFFKRLFYPCSIQRPICSTRYIWAKYTVGIVFFQCFRLYCVLSPHFNLILCALIIRIHFHEIFVVSFLRCSFIVSSPMTWQNFSYQSFDIVCNLIILPYYWFHKIWCPSVVEIDNDIEIIMYGTCGLWKCHFTKKTFFMKIYLYYGLGLGGLY